MWTIVLWCVQRLVATSSRRKASIGRLLSQWSVGIFYESTDSEEEHSPLVTGRFWSLGGGHKKILSLLISHLKQMFATNTNSSQLQEELRWKLGLGRCEVFRKESMLPNKEKQATSFLQVFESRLGWLWQGKATLYHDGGLLKLQTATDPYSVMYLHPEAHRSVNMPFSTTLAEFFFTTIPIRS